VNRPRKNLRSGKKGACRGLSSCGAQKRKNSAKKKGEDAHPQPQGFSQPTSRRSLSEGRHTDALNRGNRGRGSALLPERKRVYEHFKEGKEGREGIRSIGRLEKEKDAA